MVAPAVLVSHGIGADSNVASEQVTLNEMLGPDDNTVTDISAFLQSLLGWQPDDIVPAPEELSVPLPELETTLRPTFAVPNPSPAEGTPPWQMLIGVEPPGTDLDAPVEEARAWAATPEARFERLLRTTEIHTGLLTNGAEFRLVYTPRHEASGHATFRLADMRETGGRPILSAFLMLLNVERLFGDPDSRLIGLLEESRRYQTEVSQTLAAQVLQALYELLRGLHAADLRTGRTRLTDWVRRDPDHVYSALLTVMMRLVFVLYAEDRGLFPDHEVWARNYSLAGLFATLRDDAALHPDTMDDRYGAWARLLALFRIVHGGISHGDRLRPGYRAAWRAVPILTAFPVLEGRDTARMRLTRSAARLRRHHVAHPAKAHGFARRAAVVPHAGRGTDWFGLRDGDGLHRAATPAPGRSLAIRSAKRGGAASVIDLDRLLDGGEQTRRGMAQAEDQAEDGAWCGLALRL